MQELGGLNTVKDAPVVSGIILETDGNIDHSVLIEKEQQQFNEKYERVLAAKMQSLRYMCKLHLQICAIMSQLARHRDALIYG